MISERSRLDKARKLRLKLYRDGLSAKYIYDSLEELDLVFWSLNEIERYVASHILRRVNKEK